MKISVVLRTVPMINLVRVQISLHNAHTFGLQCPATNFVNLVQQELLE